MKNFSSFINDANNRNVNYSVVKKSAVVEQIESINSGIEVLATAALATVSATETTIATESATPNNTNQILTNNPSIVIDDDVSKSTANQFVASSVKEEDSLNSAAFRLAIPTSAKQKLASRKTKRRLIDFHFFKEMKNNSTTDDPNRANVTRVKPNNMVARKLASHATSNSILATVTFMPNSRTKFSSCLTINRNGSMRSVRSLKSLENNSNNESM